MTFSARRFVRSRPALQSLLATLASLPARVGIRLQAPGVALAADGAFLRAIRVESHGRRARLEIGEGARLVGCKITFIGDDCRLTIGAGSHLTGTELWMEDPGSSISIGDGALMYDCHIAATEGTSITLGTNAMVSSQVHIRSGDSHSILDASTGERINPARSVEIADRVWFGARSMALKGARIGPDSIVAAGSVVTGSSGPGCILAGAPAKPVRSGVRWKRERI